MAAGELAKAGLEVSLADGKPSAGRKLLMAGKSGLNLTNAAPFAHLLAQYGDAADRLRPMLTAFGGAAVQDWARSLGQEVFTGSSGRVFPRAMKASPLLRAWLSELAGQGVKLRTGLRWTGWDGDDTLFETTRGPVRIRADVTVLALGGASWSRLGSDGAWAPVLAGRGVRLVPFAPANAGLRIDWSSHMARHFGAPVKGTRLRSGTLASRGEFVISSRGLEGGGVYAVSRAVRDGAALYLDLVPDWTADEVHARLARPRGKASVATHLRKVLRFDPARMALLREFARPLPAGAALAGTIKALPVAHDGLRPLDEAISTAGGVCWSGVDAGLMLGAVPGVFVAGEMLDWEAPTGGDLLTACLATGRWAGRAAADRVKG